MTALTPGLRIELARAKVDMSEALVELIDAARTVSRKGVAYQATVERLSEIQARAKVVAAEAVAHDAT